MSNVLKWTRLAERARRLKNAPIDPGPAKVKEVTKTEPHEAAFYENPDETDAEFVSVAAQDPHEQAQEIIEEARGEAQRIMEDARLAAESDEEEARQRGEEEGFEKGYTEGKAKATAELFSATAALKEAAESLESERLVIRDKLAGSLTEVVITAARNVIASELKLNPQSVRQVVVEALRKARDREKVVIRLSPSDIALMREEKGEILAVIEGIKTLELMEDPGVTAGGCIVETESGKIDATVEERIGNLEKALEEAPPSLHEG